MIQATALKREAFILSLIDRFSQKEIQDLVPKLIEPPLTTGPYEIDATLIDEPMDKQFDKIHPSWILKALKKCDSGEKALYLSVLPPSFLKTVPEIKKIPSLSKPIASFIAQKLGDQIGLTSILPKSWIPSHPLKVLLQADSTQLERLITKIGIRDLSLDVRHTIEQTSLQKLTALLTPEEKTDLARALLEQDFMPAPQVNLKNWSLDHQSLTQRLQYHGCIRLGKALAQSDASLQWWLIHKLDQKKGLLVAKAAQSTIKPDITRQLHQQIHDAWNQLTKESR